MFVSKLSLSVDADQLIADAPSITIELVQVTQHNFRHSQN